MEYRDADIRDAFAKILNGYTNEMYQLKDMYPEIMSVDIRFSSIDEHDPDFGIYVLNNPDNCLHQAKYAVCEHLNGHFEPTTLFNVRIVGMPHDARVNIREIRSKHLNTLISIEGLVRKATEVHPKMMCAYYECRKCGEKTWEKQNGLLLKEPTSCRGCNKATTFDLDEKKSIYTDTQKIEIQESPEGLRGGAQPEKIIGYIEDDLAGMILPGDRMVLNGIIRSLPKTGREKTTVFEKYFEVISMDYEQKEYDEICITDDDLIKIKELGERDDVIDRIVGSIAPSIYGLEMEKQAIALQLFGGTRKEMDDGSSIRGDIHILLIGDPGVAKSQLLRYMSQLAPRGIFASGKSATGAGLTAAAVKDDFGDGRWTLEAGALVLADKGLACVDELDKMSETDRAGLHEAMEAQRISVAKAGITATLQCRCSMLAAANPKMSRFELDGDSVAEQINLPPSLLSRFDLIFALTDVPNRELDSNIGKHILNSHLRGQARKVKFGSRHEEVQSILDNTSSISPAYSIEFLRKYVAYAKNIMPIMTQEAIDLIHNNYINLRSKAEGGKKSIPITARQIEAYVRLTEASARARLSEKAERKDAERAINIVKYYIEKICGTREGVDFDIIDGVSKRKRDIFTAIKTAIREHDGENGAHREDIINECTMQGIEPREIIDKLDRLKDRGEIYSPKDSYYKLT